MKQQSVNRWLPCSLCLNKCGLGSSQASRQIGISKSSILRQWAKLGIRSERSDTLKLKALHKTRETRFKELWGAYERAWMDEVREPAKQEDWSYLWKKHKSQQWAKEQYQKLTPEQRRLRNQAHFKKHKEKIAERLKKWKKHKKQNDPAYRAIEAMRARLCSIAKGKSQSTMDLVGCNINEFRHHIESMFQAGMRWENYGEWQIDHIMPVSAFDHSVPMQIRQCWHFTNLRPLWASENRQKSCKITNPQLVLTLK